MSSNCKPQQKPTKPPGMAVQALAGEIIEALLADEKDGGFDLTAGMFGPNFSTLVRRWAAAEWNTSLPAQPQSNTDARAEEREACAKICDQAAADYFPAMREAASAAQHCATVIRARAGDTT